MKRTLALTGAAVAILSLAFVLLFAVEPGTLTKRSIRLDGATVVLRITKANGCLYASATEERNLWSHGWNRTMLIGSVDELGTADAAINVDDETGRLLFRVGKGGLAFNSNSRTFEMFDADAAAPD